MISGGVISGGTSTNTALQLRPTRGRASPVSFPSNNNKCHLPPNYRRVSSSNSGASRVMARAAVEDERRCEEKEEQKQEREEEEEEEEEEQHKTFYELLGISEDTSFSDIKRAYKQLARKYHPDVCPPDQTAEFTRMFIEVQVAYETLSDPGRRALYDCDLARGLHLAFSARRWNEKGFIEKSEWRHRWQNQVVELKKRSLNKDHEENMSWGARMRRQMDESD